jgi:SecD/SecF fusion protein
MQNKSGIIFLIITLSILSIYYLSFTFVARGIDNKATEVAKEKGKGIVDFNIRQNYLDSMWSVPVYPVLEYTYKQVKGKELALGLDLQGGMQVTLEVSPVEIIKALANDSKDANFLKALAEARKKQSSSQKNFADLFYAEYQKLAPNGKLADIFSNSVTKDKINLSSSNSDVLALIDKQVADAIDLSFTILRSRIDKFGVANPNIQQIPGTNRILVELPGVQNPERVRKLLTGIAKLEFWEVYETQDLATSLDAFNKYLVAKEQKDKPKSQLTTEKKEESKSNLVVKTDSAKQDTTVTKLIAKGDTNKQSEKADTAQKPEKKDTTQKPAAQSSLFTQLFQVGAEGLTVAVKDSGRVNKLLESAEVKSLFPATAKFLWDYKAGTGDRVVLYFLKKSTGSKPILDGNVVNDARWDYDSEDRKKLKVDMSMNVTGAKKWRKITRENVGKRIAIVMDNAVYSAPMVNGEIPTGNSVITGNFTMEEAKDLANSLKSGKMPAPTRIVEGAEVGPSLGAESIRQGLISTIFGFLSVVVFMLVYYSRAGLMANISLLFNLFFTLGVLASFGSVLTLSGIAGIVLSLGMSVDANVLIYERIREELQEGKTIGQAVKAGFEKAYSSILDSNATTFLVGFVLFYLGSGAVLGFATTLMVGIAVSLFCAVFITRLQIEWHIANPKRQLSFQSKFFNNAFSRTNFDFVGIRRKAYLFSAIIIAIGLGLAVLQGGYTLGVDFKGGRSYVVSFKEAVPVNQVRSVVAGAFKTGSEVKTFGKSNQVKITTSYLIEDESEEADKKVVETLKQSLNKFAAKNPKIESTSKVGATIADDILVNSLWAVAAAIMIMFLYILIRFQNWRYGLGAAISLFHNVLIVFAFVAIAGVFGFVLELDQVFIAAILTVVGYSINDTVVVFDRIREFSSGDLMRADFGKQLNTAINDTLSRTVVTGLTTIINILILLIFAGEILRGFSFAMLIGVVFGTYSSIFVASPIVLDLVARKNEKLEKQAVKVQ